MAAFSFEGGNDGGRAGVQKRLDQAGDERPAYQGMVHGAQQHSVGIGREAAQCGMKGDELTLLPVVVDDHLF